MRFFLVVFFLMLVSICEAIAGDSAALSYSCKPNKINFLSLGSYKDERLLEQDEVDALEMSFRLIYPFVAKITQRDWFKGQAVKSTILIYGEYTDMIAGKYPIKRKIDNNFLTIVEADEFDEVAVNQTICRSFLCALGLVIDYSPQQMKGAVANGNLLYFGGSYPRVGQVDHTQFIDSVVFGVDMNNPRYLEKVIDKPTILFLAEIPIDFAQLEAQPESFQTRIFFVDEWVGIYDAASQFLLRQEIVMDCVREEDLNSQNMKEILLFSETTRGMVPRGYQTGIQTGTVLNDEGEDQWGWLLDWFNYDPNIHVPLESEVKTSLTLATLGIALWQGRKFATPVTAVAAAVALGAKPADAGLCGPYNQGWDGLRNFSALERSFQNDIIEHCILLRANLRNLIFQ